jgi:hypothetical protein
MDESVAVEQLTVLPLTENSACTHYTSYSTAIPAKYSIDHPMASNPYDVSNKGVGY